MHTQIHCCSKLLKTELFKNEFWGVCVCVILCTWRSEVNVRCLTLQLYSAFLQQSFSLAWGPQVLLEQLAMRPPVACLALITGAPATTSLWCEDGAHVLTLAQRAFSSLAHPPAIKDILLPKHPCLTLPCCPVFSRRFPKAFPQPCPSPWTLGHLCGKGGRCFLQKG